MTLDLNHLLRERRHESHDLHKRYLNAADIQVQRTQGIDVKYVSAAGCYLFDESGARYLDMIAGFGVFAIGRNHPTVKRALEAALVADLPSLVQLGDASLPAGLVAEKLVERAPWLERVFFCSSGSEAVEGAMHVLEMERLIEHVGVIGELLVDRLGRLQGRVPFIRSVGGRGLMLSLDFDLDPGRLWEQVVVPLLQRHRILVSHNGSSSLRLVPAYTMNEADIDWLCNGFQDVLGPRTARSGRPR